MSLLECVLVLVAGVFAGTINTVVGSGTLVTFPVLPGRSLGERLLSLSQLPVVGAL